MWYVGMFNRRVCFLKLYNVTKRERQRAPLLNLEAPQNTSAFHGISRSQTLRGR